MGKRLACLALGLTLCALCLPALAADVGADPLTYEELMTWVDSLEALASREEPMNDPADPESLTEDGYAFVYDFGILYYNQVEANEDRTLLSAVLYDEEVPGPRNTNTLTGAQELLDAFYLENPQLDGTPEEAMVYMTGSLPDGVWWGQVRRDGQWLESVQYTAHERTPAGLYTDAGIVFTLQQNTVVAIRAYGIDKLITAEDVQAELSLLTPKLYEGGYVRVPTSAEGASPVFEEADLQLGWLNLADATPEQALAALGEAEADEEIQQDDGSVLRVMSFEGATLVFTSEAPGGRPVLTLMTLDGGNLEGPRSLRIGDSLTMAMQRFRFGEGESDGETERLYGTPGEGSWGEAEYHDDASAVLRYAAPLKDGRTAQLVVSFEMLELSEVNVSIGR